MDNKESEDRFGNISFLKIFHAFRIAVHPKNLMIAFMFLACIWCAGRLMDLNPTVVTGEGGISELDVYMDNSSQVPAFIEENRQSGSYKGVFDTGWKFLQIQLDSQ